jgi:hypothetical protein
VGSQESAPPLPELFEIKSNLKKKEEGYIPNNNTKVLNYIENQFFFRL